MNRFFESLAKDGWVQNLSAAALVVVTAVVCTVFGMSAFRISVVTACVLLTALVWILGWRVIRAYDTPPDAASIRVKVQTSMIPRDQVSALLWLRPRLSRDTLQSIPILLYAAVTNIKQVPLTIDSMAVQVKAGDKEWIKLKAVRTYAEEIWWVYGIPNGLRDAGQLDFSTTGLDQLLMDKQLTPNVPVRGWMLFRRPANFNGILEGTKVQWKFTAQDSLGNKLEAVTDPDVVTREVPDNMDIQPNAPRFVFGPSHIDISSEIKHIEF